MIEDFPLSLKRLIRELSRLPSVGEKSATRLAYFLISQGRAQIPELVQALKNASEQIKFCETCFHLSEGARCSICNNSTRDQSIMCVVEKPMDVVAVERTGEYRGLYHVLHGLWAPLKGKGPESMKLKELSDRISVGQFREVIVATSTTVEGDATALYVARILAPFNIPVTRLAQGMPKGGELEFADDFTLSRAFSGRSRLNDGA